MSHWETWTIPTARPLVLVLACTVSIVHAGPSEADIGAIVYDERKVDDVVLALLHLNVLKDKYGWRAWKGFDWDALDRLHERGLIGNPRSKARSVPLTDEGAALAEELFQRHFGRHES